MKRKILSKAVVLLIMSVMVLSTIPATTAETGIGDDLYDQWMKDQIHSDQAPTLAEDEDLIPQPSNQLKISDPLRNMPTEDTLADEFVDAYFNYDVDVTDYAWGLNGGVNNIVEGGMKVTPAEWAGYSSWDIITVETIKFHHGGFLSQGGIVGGAPHSGQVLIYEDPADDWGDEVASAPFTTVGDIPDWYEITLSTPFEIDPLKTYTFGVQFECSASEYVMGIDYPTGVGVPGQSHFLRYDLDGTQYAWSDEAAAGYGNVHIRLGLTEETGVQQGCDFAVEIIDPVDGTTNSLPKTVDILVKNFGLDPIEEAKVLLDVYQEVPGPCSDIFFEDFEDLDAVAANWTVDDGNMDDDTWFINGPCGSVNRSYSGEYSYRSTAGNQRPPCPGSGSDTYLANADDTLCLDNPVDMSGAAYGTISFWHWAQGEAGDYLQDYGTVSVSNGITTYDIPASEFAAYDNGWQQFVIGVGAVPGNVDVDTIAPIALTDEMTICFNWQADPHLCYEGWYIDDVLFTRCEDPSYQLVFQSHLIVEDIPAEEFEGIPFSFPLSFTPQDGATYFIEVCGQVFIPAGCDTRPDNDCDSVWITIKDVCDAASIETTGPVHIQACEEADFDVTVKNVGTFPEDEIPVTLEVAKILKEQDFDGFEGMAWNSFGVNDMTHISTCDPYEGNNCLAFTQKTCDEPHYKPYSFSFAYKPVLYDMGGDNVVGGTLKYAARWSLSGQIGSSNYGNYQDPIPPVDPTGNVYFYDHWFIVLIDWETGYYVPVTHDTVAGVYGGPLSFNEYWESSCEPGTHPGMFEVDLFALMDEIHDSYGLFENKQLGIGFAFVSNDDEYILRNDQDDFSGLYIDNVIVETTFTDEDNFVEVDSGETGYLAPGEMETLTLTWDDTCGFCDYTVAGITHLDCDENVANDVSMTNTRITENWEDDINFDSIDNTGGDSLWHCTDDCAPTDNYMWAGDDATGEYVPLMDDSLISPVIDLGGYDTGTMTFETWYQFESGDYGEVQVSDDAGQHWTTELVLSGFSAGWEMKALALPASADVQIRFRMRSDDDINYNGWYVDSIEVLGNDAPIQFFAEDFNAGMPAGWMQTQYSGTGVWEVYDSAAYEYIEPPNEDGLYIAANSDDNPSDVYDVEIFSTSFDMTGVSACDFIIDKNFQDFAGDGEGYINVYSNGIFEEQLWWGTTDDPYGGEHLEVVMSPGGYTDPSDVQLGFWYSTNGGTWAWGFGIDNLEVSAPASSDVVFTEEFDDCAAGWTMGTTEGGDWWNEVDYAADPFTPSPPACDDDGVAIWNGDPATGEYYTGAPVNNEYITEIDLTETADGEEYTSVDLSFATWYDFGAFYYYDQWSDTYDQFILARGKVQVSTDYGETWNTLRDYTFSSGGWINEVINLDCYIPNVIQLRFIFTCVGEIGVPNYVGGEEQFLAGEGWYIDCLELDIKHEILFDQTPPKTTALICDGEIVLDAYDPVDPDSGISSGVCGTFYILDGGDVTEYVEPITVTGDGEHEIEYWSIDCWDPPNEETHKTETFTIDTTPPTVSIDEPTEGLYLFGSKTIALSGRIVAIGKLPITVSASDAISDVDFIELQFTGAAEDSAHISGNSGTYVFNEKAFGEVTVTAVAQDTEGLRSNSESLTFKIYCLGLF